MTLHHWHRYLGLSTALLFIVLPGHGCTLKPH